MEPTRPDSAPWRDVLVLTLLAALYRFFFVWAMPRAIDSPDAIGYLRFAQSMAGLEGGVANTNLPLLYPLLCAPLMALGVEAEWAGRIVALIAGLMLIPAVYFVALPLFGRTAARIACVAVALWPWLADYAWRISPDGLALTLWFASFALLIRAMRVGGPWAIAAGLCFFALHLARPEGSFLFLGSIVPAALLAPDRAALVRRFAPLAGVTLAGIALQALVMRIVAGSTAVNTRVTNPARSIEYVLVERGTEAAQALFTLAFETLPLMVGPYLFLFAGVALLLPSKMRDGRAELALLAFAAGHVALAGMSTYAEPRYILAPVVAVSLWGARGIVMSASAMLVGDARRWAVLPIAGLLAWQALTTALTVLPEHLGRLPRMPHEYRIAGEWLRDNAEPGVIITRRTQIAFYAGMTATGPGETEPLPDLIARAQRLGARYLVVDERHGVAASPALRPLLDPANAPPSLRLLTADVSPYANGRVVIYEILPP